MTSQESQQAALEIPRRSELEVADIFRAHGKAYIQSHRVTPEQGAVIRAMTACRTEALGGHLEVCDSCGYIRPSYNSCRNRHCPKCQSLSQARWLEERLNRLLPTRFFHLVFTLPAELRPLVLQNRKLMFNMLFDSASRTLLELSKDPNRLGAQPGITAVLHTWNRDLGFHPHLHCIVTGGGLAPSGDTWVPSKMSRYLFPNAVLSSLFRLKLLDALTQAYNRGELVLQGDCAPLANPASFLDFKDKLYRKKWVVYAKQPFGSVDRVFRYLGQYTHRVGLSNQRLISLDDEKVTFITRGTNTVTLTAHEFIRRFLLHVLPKRFVKIRHYGLLAPCNVNTKLAIAKSILEAQNPAHKDGTSSDGASVGSEKKSWVQLMAALTGKDLSRCPKCKEGKMISQPLPPGWKDGPPGGVTMSDTS
jgi:hypothetical protein